MAVIGELLSDQREDHLYALREERKDVTTVLLLYAAMTAREVIDGLY
jgi:hypothetical protein